MIISLLITIVFGVIYFYVKLPAINLHTAEFYTFVYLLCIVYCGANILVTGFRSKDVKEYFRHLWKKCTVPVVIVAALIVISAVGGLAGSVIFRAKSYSELLPITENIS